MLDLRGRKRAGWLDKWLDQHRRAQAQTVLFRQSEPQPESPKRPSWIGVWGPGPHYYQRFTHCSERSWSEDSTEE